MTLNQTPLYIDSKHHLLNKSYIEYFESKLKELFVNWSSLRKPDKELMEKEPHMILIDFFSASFVLRDFF